MLITKPYLDHFLGCGQALSQSGSSPYANVYIGGIVWSVASSVAGEAEQKSLKMTATIAVKTSGFKRRGPWPNSIENNFVEL